MEWYEAIILGIVQGLTEFLPISSSGHLEIASYILKTNPSENLMFTVVVHIATAISIIYVFRKDINEIIKGLIQFKKKQLDFILKIENFLKFQIYFYHFIKWFISSGLTVSKRNNSLFNPIPWCRMYLVLKRYQQVSKCVCV